MQGAQALPADSIRHVVQRVLAAPEYDWTQAVNPLAFLWRYPARLLRWLADFGAHHPAAYTAIVAASVVVLTALLVHLGYLTWRALRRPGMVRAPGSPAPAPSRDAGWHLAQTDRLKAQGRYAEALAHRFSALLLTLQGTGAVIFRPWKTPAEYVPEARLDEPSRAELGALVTVLYRHVFGGVPCTGPDLEDFDRRASGMVAHFAPQ